jgi:hypothetical protein
VRVTGIDRHGGIHHAEGPTFRVALGILASRMDPPEREELPLTVIQHHAMLRLGHGMAAGSAENLWIDTYLTVPPPRDPSYHVGHQFAFVRPLDAYVPVDMSTFPKRERFSDATEQHIERIVEELTTEYSGWRSSLYFDALRAVADHAPKIGWRVPMPRAWRTLRLPDEEL